MSETAQRTDVTAGRPPGEPTGSSALDRLRGAGLLLIRQREATVFVVVVLLLLYFGVVNSTGRSVFFGKLNMITLSQEAAPTIIIALGEVLLLICGEIDLSVGFIYAFTPFIMYFLISSFGVPGILAIVLALAGAAGIGWVNAFLTVTVGLPSFVTTLGTGFIIGGMILVFNQGEQAVPPNNVLGIGHWIGTYAWSEITWAVILAVLCHILLRQTRWGLHTIAVGGNAVGAAEAGVNIARIKYGNFMLTGLLGGFAGLQLAFQTSIIDTQSGGAAYIPMFYAVAAAVIGGTAMLGGSGTIIGAFLGAVMLAVLQDGFAVVGIGAYPLQIYFGAVILIAMILNVQLARLRDAGRLG